MSSTHPTIFISYSNAVESTAKLLIKSIESMDYRCFSRERIQEEVNTNDESEDNLLDADCYILLMSKDIMKYSQESSNSIFEASVAIAQSKRLGIFVIQILLNGLQKDDLPALLRVDDPIDASMLSLIDLQDSIANRMQSLGKTR